MSRQRFIRSKPSRVTVAAAVGTVLAGAITAAVTGVLPATFARPAAPGPAADLARAARQHGARQGTTGRAVARRRPAHRAEAGSPRQIAITLLPSYGWSSSQFDCLNALWTRESGWNTYATNPSSGAYGIPQSQPAEKMASAGADWQTNPAAQIRWGLGYIRATYGSPCGAWRHETGYGWY